MGDRTGVTIEKAAARLFENDFTIGQVNTILGNLKKPTAGYVYMEDVMKYINQ